METSGARLEAVDLEPYLAHERIVALAEMMNYPGVIHRDPGVLAKIAHARRHHKPIDGHAPGLCGSDLTAYVAAGITSDHECTTAEEAREKLAAGMHIMIREGTGAKNLKSLLPIVTPATCRRVMWCTDDRHPHDLLAQGHIDSMIRQAIGRGLDPVTAIQMATLNPADYFNLRHLGAVAPGRQADLVVFQDLAAPRVEEVYCRGERVAQNGKMAPTAARPAPVPVPPSMQRGSGRHRFQHPGRRSTNSRHRPGPRPDRHPAGSWWRPPWPAAWPCADIDRDLLKIAVVERHPDRDGSERGSSAGSG